MQTEMSQDELIDLISKRGGEHNSRLKDIYWMLQKFKFFPQEINWLYKEYMAALPDYEIRNMEKETERVK